MSAFTTPEEKQREINELRAQNLALESKQARYGTELLACIAALEASCAAMAEIEALHSDTEEGAMFV